MWTIFPLLLAPASPALAQQDTLPVVRIAFVFDGPVPNNEEFLELFAAEIREVLRGEFDVQFPAAMTREADHTLSGVSRVVDELLIDPRVDLLIPLHPLGSYDVTRRGPLPKPVVAPFVMDPEVQSVPLADGASGVRNLSYVAQATQVIRDLTAFQEVAPFTTLTVLGNPRWEEATTAITDGATAAARTLGVELRIIPVDRPIEEALQAIPVDAEAVYVTPLLHLTQPEWDELIAELNRRRLPTFSMVGVDEVHLGVLATMRPDTYFPQVARRVALNVQRILLGEEAGSLPVFFDCGERLTINMATARAIGRFPNWNVLTEAFLLNEEETPPERELSLVQAARDALEANLDLAVQDLVVSAGEEDVLLARSALLPQMGTTATGLIIDEDRAESSFGAQAQRTFTGGATVTQLVYSEPAWANLAVQQQLQASRVERRREVRLDITLAAATAYLAVLQAKALERVQRENLLVSRSNLELARVRRAVGSGRAGEVLRWESQIATDRQRVISSESQRALAEIQLNRLLHRPLEERFATTEMTAVITPDGRVRTTDPALITSDERLVRYGSNLQAWEVFRNFMVEEGLSLSPELNQLEAAITAQRRAYRSTTNSFWSPTIALQGSVDHRFARGGTGSSGFALPDLPDGFPSFPQANDLSWNVALSFSLPIFNGGSRIAERARASEVLRQLEVERAAAAERIQQRIRSALHTMGSSYMNVGLSAAAARAARENLELVRDAYRRGAISIIELLDAQNAALAADEAAANAVYVFLADHMRMQRAIGRFDLFMTQEERDWFITRLDAYFVLAGVSPS
jgi:outer membrane protein TolC